MFVMLAYVSATTLNVALIFSRMDDQFFATYNLIKALISIGFFLTVVPIVDRLSRSVLLVVFICAVLGAVGFARTLLPTNITLCLSILAACEGVLLTGFSVLFWSSFTGAFTTLEGKKYFPIVASAYGVGGIAGGLAISRLAKTIGTEGLIWFWMSCLAACLVAVLFLGLILMRAEKAKKEQQQTEPRQAPEADDQEAAKRKLRAFGAAVFFYIFAIWMIRRVVEYRFNLTIDQSVAMDLVALPIVLFIESPIF